MSFKNLIKILSFFIVIECLTKPVFAAPSKKTTPTRITSEIIDIKRKSQTMEFLGNVVVRKGADTMIADKMMVFYLEEVHEDEKDKENEGELTEEEKMQKEAEEENVRKRDRKVAKDENKDMKIKKIDAYDHVKVSTAEFVATGDAGHYDPIQDLFVLEDNVVVNNGKSIANGEKFIYNLKTKKGNFVGDTSPSVKNKKKDNRVVVTIGNEDLKGKKKPKKEENKND